MRLPVVLGRGSVATTVDPLLTEPTPPCTYVGVDGGVVPTGCVGRRVARKTYVKPVTSASFACACAVSCATTTGPSHEASFALPESKHSTVGGSPLRLCAMTTEDVGVSETSRPGKVQS